MRSGGVALATEFVERKKCKRLVQRFRRRMVARSRQVLNLVLWRASPHLCERASMSRAKIVLSAGDAPSAARRADKKQQRDQVAVRMAGCRGGGAGG